MVNPVVNKHEQFDGAVRLFYQKRVHLDIVVDKFYDTQEGQVTEIFDIL
jgi:hypothetical protein